MFNGHAWVLPNLLCPPCMTYWSLSQNPSRWFALRCASEITRGHLEKRQSVAGAICVWVLPPIPPASLIGTAPGRGAWAVLGINLASCSLFHNDTTYINLQLSLYQTQTFEREVKTFNLVFRFFGMGETDWMFPGSSCSVSCRQTLWSCYFSPCLSSLTRIVSPKRQEKSYPVGKS